MPRNNYSIVKTGLVEGHAHPIDMDNTRKNNIEAKIFPILIEFSSSLRWLIFFCATRIMR